MDSITAAKNNDIDFIQATIAGKGDIDLQDSSGMTPLMIAIENENTQLVRILLEAKARLDNKDNFGQTAYFLASQKHNLGIIKVLLAFKCKKARRFRDFWVESAVARSKTEAEKLSNGK